MLDMELFKDPAIANRLSKQIKESVPHSLRLMEVCGTHTVAIFRSGIRSLLPEEITLLSGPGCPVCVTAIEDVDRAIKLAGQSDVILTTFGDMMRVPGSTSSLYEEKARGREIRIVYSPMDCLKIARENPEKKVIFFATGFETTSPSVAATTLESRTLGLKNFYIFSVHKLVPPAISALLSSEDVRLDGLILPGHVSTIIGIKPYEFIASQYSVPSVISGFEPIDILQAIYMLVLQIKNKEPKIGLQYKRVVCPDGNQKAAGLINTVFKPADAKWRGIGVIPQSGLKLRDEFSFMDAEKIFDADVPQSKEPSGCSCGEVLRGVKIPTDCPLFAKACTPENPIGACMVSTEGSCAAYYKYGVSFPL
ncbi:MAG: hydrogenase formation protein HypD [Nitrospirae bacterium]|nr:hydrogenase formation protein HypD [Nitrospirota bacterium]